MLVASGQYDGFSKARINAIHFESDSIFSETSNGAWSTEGCSVLSVNRTRVTCQCTHLTNFALLLQVTPDYQVSVALLLK